MEGISDSEVLGSLPALSVQKSYSIIARGIVLMAPSNPHMYEREREDVP